MYKIIGGVKVFLPTTIKEADNMFHDLHQCQNCAFYNPKTLFSGMCENDYLYQEAPFEVECGNCLYTCECFTPEKIVDYWLGKLISIKHDLNGENDSMRIFMIENNLR